jgi:ArsR family transcriptional regulator
LDSVNSSPRFGLTTCWLVGIIANKESILLITFDEAEIRARIVKAIGHPVRLMVIDFLKDGERSFSEIFDLFQLDKSTVSKHLLVLKGAGIVSSRKEGADMFYKLEVPCVIDFFTCVTAVIESNVKKQQVCLSQSLTKRRRR